MPRNVEEIISLNKARFNALNAHYDPLKGEGSLLDRFEFKMSDKESVYLPMPMKGLKVIQALQKFKSLEDYCKKKKENPEALKGIFNEIREKHDFEYYAIVNLKIQDKKTKKIIPFSLNRPQRKLLKTPTASTPTIKKTRQ